jgi:CheY-like chemotaxis protein
VLERRRALDPGIRAIASSGYSADTVMVRPQAHGFDARLAKPYTAVEIGEVASLVLSAR